MCSISGSKPMGHRGSSNKEHIGNIWSFCLNLLGAECKYFHATKDSLDCSVMHCPAQYSNGMITFMSGNIFRQSLKVLNVQKQYTALTVIKVNLSSASTYLISPICHKIMPLSLSCYLFYEALFIYEPLQATKDHACTARYMKKWVCLFLTL